MEIKGTAVKTIPEFVKARFPEQYDEWFDELPDESKKIMGDAIYATNWYPLEFAGLIPTRKIGEVFYNNDIKKGAWEAGRYSAEVALKGVYKVFIRLTSPTYIIGRAGRIFSTYYRPSELKVIDNGKKYVIQHILQFPMPDIVVEYRIAGWMQQALELNHCKNVKVEFPKTMTKGDAYTEISITWD